jgi:hypothetical protein
MPFAFTRNSAQCQCVTPYGMFRLDMSKRLDIDAVMATA